MEQIFCRLSKICGMKQWGANMDNLKIDRVGERSLTAADDCAISCIPPGQLEDQGAVVTPTSAAGVHGIPTKDDAESDIDAMVASLGLQSIRRYMDQYHWHEESQLARAADEAEPGLKLENVAAHSWHVADAIMLLAPNFPEVDLRRALELAILHDKLELFTGDFDPVGPAGDGSNAHVFDPRAGAAKMALELAALDHYVSRLRPPIRTQHRNLLLETIHGQSAEARLVKAVDKLQALAFVLEKKAGAMTDEHLVFSLRYSAKAVEYFPKLIMHHRALVRRLIRMIADYRNVATGAVIAALPEPVRPMATAAEV